MIILGIDVFDYFGYGCLQITKEVSKDIHRIDFCHFKRRKLNTNINVNEA